MCIGMDALAILFVLLSAIFHSIWNFLAKTSQDKYVFSWWMKMFEFILYLPLSIYLWATGEIQSAGWMIVILSGVVHFAYWILLMSSYTFADLSIVYPIARSAPVLVTLFAVLFFDEQLSTMGLFGILSVMGGVYLLTIDGARFHSWSILRNKGVLFAVLTALAVTAYSLIDKQGAPFFPPILYVWLENAVSLLPLSTVIFLTKHSGIVPEWQKNKWIIIISGFLGLLSYSLIVFVMQTFQVSYIVSIRQVSVVFGVILGGTILNERHLKKRLLASILVFIGLFLITTS
jgi:drug/metabolite transporter (DMT)-like permease